MTWVALLTGRAIDDGLVSRLSPTLQSTKALPLIDLEGALTQSTVTGITFEAEATAFNGTHCIRGTSPNSLAMTGAFTSASQVMTFAGWYKSTGTEMLLLDLNPGSPRITLNYNHSNMGGNMGFFDGANGSFAATAPANDTWFHLVILDNGTDTRCYVNGVQIGNSLRSMNLGAGTYGTVIVRATNARFDTIRIYNRSLSTAEVIELYNAGRNENFVAATPPANSTPPIVTGTATVGQTLTTTQGAWTGNPTPAITLKWQSGNQSDGSDMADIAGQTGATFLLTALELGKYVRSVATGTNTEGSASANSNIVGPIIAAAGFKAWYASQRSQIIGSGVR